MVIFEGQVGLDAGYRKLNAENIDNTIKEFGTYTSEITVNYSF